VSLCGVKTRKKKIVERHQKSKLVNYYIRHDQRMAITAELSYRHTHTHTHKDIIATQVIELTNGMEQIGELLSSYFF
jgi:hypothetical protein